MVDSLKAVASGATDATVPRPPYVRISLLAPFDTQLFKPSLRPGTVRRVGRLPALADTDARVIVVSAPPGYGKTTLVAEWEEIDERQFAWVTVTERENAASGLVAYVIRALHAIEPLEETDLAVLARIDADVTTSLLPRLGSVLERRSRPFVLVLDDVHVLSSTDSDAVVSTLVDHLPPDSKMVLAGRRRPRLRLGRLRASDELFELDAAALALRDDESEMLLHACGLDLTRQAMTALTERTEGWPAGLYLAALSLQASRDVVGAALEYSGNDRFVGEYLRDELLRSVNDDVVAFLLQTSMLERLSGSLCDAVLDRAGSARVLDDLAASNLMILPLDRRGEWYRYHHLLRDVLADELRLRNPEFEKTLNRRASLWFEDVGDHDAAIRHAFAAGDGARAI
jgi:LuxR family transcriptional regulator, maltose regulon positive regulatory protein